MAKRRARRKFTAEYKAEVVQLVRTSGKSIGAIAKELDLTEGSVREWVQRAEVDEARDPNGPLTTEERAEVARPEPLTHFAALLHDAVARANHHQEALAGRHGLRRGSARQQRLEHRKGERHTAKALQKTSSTPVTHRSSVERVLNDSDSTSRRSTCVTGIWSCQDSFPTLAIIALSASPTARPCRNSTQFCA